MENPPFFKDRSAGLIVFGVLTMLMGGFCALMVPLMIFAVAGQGTEGATTWRTLVPSMMTYALLAITLAWLGLGSILKRRWARPLLLMFAWMWLMIGVVLLVATSLMLPYMLASLSDTGESGLPEQFIVIFTLVCIGFGFILMPLIWILFYSSRHVKATCEARHPAPSWTDQCPTQVLALSLSLALGVPFVLIAPFSTNSLFPLFGIFVDGWMGAGFYVLSAIVCAAAAWLTFKLDRRGWWLVLGLTVFFGLSSFLTYWKNNLFDVYRRMGIPESQTASLQDFALFQGSNVAWITVVPSLLMVAYVIYTFRFFKHSSQGRDDGVISS